MSAIISAGGPSFESPSDDAELCPLSEEASLSLSEAAALSPGCADLRFYNRNQLPQVGIQQIRGRDRPADLCK